MSMKRFFLFPKAPGQEPHQQMQFSVSHMTLVVCSGISWHILQPQLKGHKLSIYLILKWRERFEKEKENTNFQCYWIFKSWLMKSLYKQLPCRQDFEYADCIPCRGVRPHPQIGVIGKKLHLIVRFEFWRSGECGVPLHCHYSQVH